MDATEHLDHEDYLLKCRKKNAEKQRRYREAERERLNTCSTDNIIKQRQKDAERKRQYRKSQRKQLMEANRRLQNVIIVEDSMEEPLESVDNTQKTDDDITKQRNKDAERKRKYRKAKREQLLEAKR